MEDIYDKLSKAKTRTELDALRPEVVGAMKADGTEQTFREVQSAFRKRKNQIRRTPGWWE